MGYDEKADMHQIITSFQKGDAAKNLAFYRKDDLKGNIDCYVARMSFIRSLTTRVRITRKMPLY